MLFRSNLKKIGNWDRVHEKFKTYYIINFGEDEWGSYVALNHKQHSDGFDQKWDLDIVNDNLKHPYVIINNINESEDFDVEAPEDWEKEFLTVGDKITPDMWDNVHGFKFREPVYIIDIGTDDGGDFVLLNNKPHSDFYDTTWDLDEINWNLKHPYTIVNNINESEEDDFNVTSPEEWNYYYLTDRDTITPDMWNKSTPAREIRLRSFLYDPDQDWTFKFIPDYPDRVMMTSKGGVHYVLEIKTVNSLLKHQYQIDEPLNEQDEFNVDAPKEWNKILLTKGDYITPDMWKEIPKKFSNPPQSVEIGGFGLAGDANDIEEVRLIKSDMSHVAYSFQLDDLNNELLKPEYQIVHLVGGNNKWKEIGRAHV